MTSTLSAVLDTQRIALFPADDVGSSPSESVGAGTWRRLAVPEQMQQQTQWCWSATSVSIHAFYDPNNLWTQCTFANAKMNRTDCCTNGGSTACNQPNYPDQALTLLGNFVRTDSSAEGMPAVQTEIDNGRPISFRIGWSGGGGHNPAVVGYRTDPTGDWVAVVDPIFGPSDIRYTTLLTAYQGNGSWTHSYLTKSAPIRIGGLVAPARAATMITSREPAALDVIAVDTGGAIQTAALFEAGQPTSWRGWWAIAGGRAKAGSPVTVVSRSADKLDAFVIGTDGGVWTAAWQPDWNAWRGWGHLDGVTVPQGSEIGVACRSIDRLDVMVTDVNGAIMTRAWRPTVQGGWPGGWTSVAGGHSTPGAPVSIVSRSADKLDAFVVGTDGGVWTAAWQPDWNAWRGWGHLAGVTVPLGSSIGAVCRSADKLDIFVTDTGGAIRSTAWQPTAQGGWPGWWPIAGGRAAPGAPVTAVSRATDFLDIFVISTGGVVNSAAWTPADGANWRGWWPASQVQAVSATRIGAVPRPGGGIDIVFAGADGGIYNARWAQDVAGGRYRG